MPSRSRIADRGIHDDGDDDQCADEHVEIEPGRLQEQEKSGLATRYVDHGHQVSATFYSPEGSAVQLQDTAQLEIQLLDGRKVVSSKNVTRKYVAVVSVVEDSWKVRVLDGVQEF